MARTSKKSPNTARQRRQATMPPSPLAQQSQQQLENIRTALAHDQTELAVTLLATLQQQDPANPQALLLAGTLQGDLVEHMHPNARRCVLEAKNMARTARARPRRFKRNAPAGGAAPE